MKKFTFALLVTFFVHQLSAVTLYDQLCNFNFNWKKYALRAPAGEARVFNSDKEYIQAHLTCVLAVLRSNPVTPLNAQQLDSRRHLIELLDGYRIAGKFPVNYYRHERIPVFIDERRTHCAVGYLLQQTGHEEMALRIAAADNYAWLKDIHDPEFPSWQEASGLTVEELKLIQGAYDFYMPDAFIAPNKYEIPQKPSAMLVYFENEVSHKPLAAKTENIWCRGEAGINGVLNGKWEQNYAVGIPWIVGYYENGKRSGQWQEYYQGTKQLCRTENWRNDKLNGLRKRFDRSGNLIEEIMFRNGNAVTKTNYDLYDSLTYVRKPLDSVMVWTEVYNFEGSLIAAGKERIYNPGNLLWFQNIELTALNSISIQSREVVTQPYIYGRRGRSIAPVTGINLYGNPQLVQYKKEGDWVYYKEYNYSKKTSSNFLKDRLKLNYKHFGMRLADDLSIFDDQKVLYGYDSLHVTYSNNYIRDFYGYGTTDFVHFRICYEAPKTPMTDPSSVYLGSPTVMGMNYYPYEAPPVIEECGQYNRANERIGTWKHFKGGVLYKTENFLIPWKEEEEGISLQQ